MYLIYSSFFRPFEKLYLFGIIFIRLLRKYFKKFFLTDPEKSLLYIDNLLVVFLYLFLLFMMISAFLSSIVGHVELKEVTDYDYIREGSFGLKPKYSETLEFHMPKFYEFFFVKRHGFLKNFLCSRTKPYCYSLFDLLVIYIGFSLLLKVLYLFFDSTGLIEIFNFKDLNLIRTIGSFLPGGKIPAFKWHKLKYEDYEKLNLSLAIFLLLILYYVLIFRKAVVLKRERVASFISQNKPREVYLKLHVKGYKNKSYKTKYSLLRETFSSSYFFREVLL